MGFWINKINIAEAENNQNPIQIIHIHEQNIKPPLSTDLLLNSGFYFIGQWIAGTSTANLVLNGTIPKQSGVYAFAQDGIVLYVGVASKDLASRLYFYSKPGSTQKTNIRLNKLMLELCGNGVSLDVYTASPPDLEWQGLPVSGSAGLEAGLVRKFHLPWNKRI